MTPDATALPLVSRDDVLAAQRLVAPRVHRTPTTRSSYLSDRFSADVWLKLELLQKTGSFKVRGVLNKMATLTPAERARGVVTLSAGNHAQAVAWAAREAGIRATVVMPSKAVQSKIDATRDYGAELILTDADLLETARGLEAERGLTLIHPFDDGAVIAGQGTLAEEIFDDLPETDVLLIGVGGGGVLSGVGVVARARRSSARVIGVEPEGAAVMRLSLDRGSPQRLSGMTTIADGLAAPFAGAIPFAHVTALGLEIVTVPEEAIVEALWLLIERCKVVPEPAACVGLAALISGAVTVERGARTVIIVTGGNVGRQRLGSLA